MSGGVVVAPCLLPDAVLRRKPESRSSGVAPGNPGLLLAQEHGAGEGQSLTAERVVAAARAAIGARFRLHGRDPAFGLDCVGLAALAVRAAGFSGDIPAGYALRGGRAEALAARFDASGLVRGDGAAGDLALFETGPAQFHLAVMVAGGIVHADAMLRRVVERPGAPPWPVIGYWRVKGE